MKKYPQGIVYAAEVLSFLKQNSCRWFTAWELYHLMDLSFSTIKGALVILVRTELVKFKKGRIKGHVLLIWLGFLGGIMFFPFSLESKLSMLGGWGFMTLMGWWREIGRLPNQYAFCKDDENNNGDNGDGEGEPLEEIIKRELKRRGVCVGEEMEQEQQAPRPGRLPLPESTPIS